MEFITIVIARLIAGQPMPGTQWITFRHDVARCLRELVAVTGTGKEWLEISSGATEWNGHSEPCATFTLMNASLALVPVIKENLKDLPARYGQDAIGVRYGTADLIQPASAHRA